MRTPLAESMQLAWLTKAHAAAIELTHAAQAPALFKPERVAQVEADYQHARRWARYWAAQS